MAVKPHTADPSAFIHHSKFTILNSYAPSFPRNPLSPPLRSPQQRPQGHHAKSKYLAVYNLLLRIRDHIEEVEGLEEETIIKKSEQRWDQTKKVYAGAEKSA